MDRCGVAVAMQVVQVVEKIVIQPANIYVDQWMEKPVWVYV